MKKIVSLLLATCMSLFVATMLTACDVVHKHALIKVDAESATCESSGNSEYFYCYCGKYFSIADGTTEIEKDSWVIPSTGHSFASTWTYNDTHHWKVATCEHTTEKAEYAEHTITDNQCDCGYDNRTFVTVTNATEAQEALDSAVDDTVIYLSEAVNYGDLLIRINEDSELVDYYYVMSNYDSNYYGQASWQYAKRTINNITITGVEGAVIDSLSTSKDRDDNGNAKGTHNNMFEINNLTISGITIANGITFNVSNVKVGVSSTETVLVPSTKLNGLTIDNCKTTTGGETGSNPGRKLLGIANTGSVSNAKNIVVTNCTVTDMYQGVYIVDGENVLVEGNSFNGLTHNAIHINSFCSGDILIRNNVIANVAERPLRFNKVSSGTITIKDNTITNSGDSANELFKASTMSADNITWHNNTIDGVSIELIISGNDIIGKQI